MNDELTLLKERAKTLGISHSPNIGLEALKQKIQAKLDGTDAVGSAPSDDDEDYAELTPSQRRKHEAHMRHTQHQEQMKLVRLRITNLNPVKKDLRGEIITVGNKYIGTVRKFVPFGEATDAGYHVPFCIYNELKERKFISVKRRKAANGQQVIEQFPVPEFALEVLTPLTEQELAQLARNQAAAQGL